MPADLETTRSDFIEKIGVIAQTDGLPRSAGRVLALLVWDGDAVAFGDLSEQLQVSRGSISTATRILLDRQLIKRIAKPGIRQDFFQLADAPYLNMMQGMATSLARSQDDINATIALIPDDQDAIKRRVSAYARFYQSLSNAVTTVIDEIK